LIAMFCYFKLVQKIQPTPEHVNFSESGLSFYSEKQIQDGTYIHLTLSHPENFFHIAAIAQVVYSNEEENGKCRTGAYFITLHPQDRVKLADCISLAVEDH
jgi:hypothetical protein